MISTSLPLNFPVPFPAHSGDFFLMPEIKPKHVLLDSPPLKVDLLSMEFEVYWNSNVT